MGVLMAQMGCLEWRDPTAKGDREGPRPGRILGASVRRLAPKGVAERKLIYLEEMKIVLVSKGFDGAAGQDELSTSPLPRMRSACLKS
jgi:hypothetical protein